MSNRSLSRREFLSGSAATLASLASTRVNGEAMGTGTTTVILGGGIGGIATARLLRTALPAEHRIRLVSKSRDFQMGTTKTWVMLRQAERRKVTRPLSALRRHGIEVLHTEVERIHPATGSVTTIAGDLQADYLVIALGAELNMGAVPGLEGAAETFYTRDGASRLRTVLRGFSGGRIVLLVPRVPFQCPPAPYEAAMMLHSHLEERGIRARSTIEIHTVERAPMATAGPDIGRYVIGRLQERDIGFHPQRQVESVDGTRKVVVMADGQTVSYDLLIAVPPHQAPRAVCESALTNSSGWVPADPKTLELAPSPAPHRVYAIGDVAVVPLPGRFAPDAPLVLPKAGVFAERQAAVVAAQIAAHVLGREATESFDGKGFCYIEVGGGRAVRGDGSFFAVPHPTMAAGEPDAGQLAEKKAWVEKWMATYL